jgi:hypothetical protein
MNVFAGSTRRVARTTCRIAPLAVLVALALPCAAQADSVTDWNAVASGPVVAPRFGGPPPQFRAIAITHIAIHDALNSIQPRYRGYNALPAAAAGASADAAVAAAARTTLVGMIEALPPNAAETAARAAAIDFINARYAAVIGPDIDAAEAAGIAAGELAATTVFQQRHAFNGTKWVAVDGSQSPNAPAYAAGAAIGMYVQTPGSPAPQFTGWEFLWPFAIDSADQFRVPPGQVLDVSSKFYADQYNEVKHQGDARVRGAHPDSQQTQIARFWPAGGLDWNANLRVIVAGRGLDRWQHARLFALANMSVNDSLISVFRSKYYYTFWRPVTAIRWADDGNPDTESDPTWTPFLATPPYPDYPCGSTGVTGAVTQTLRNFFGTNAVGFSRTITVPAFPVPALGITLPATDLTRKYNSLSIAENEQARARMYEGIHFTEGCYASIKSANRVADWVYRHRLAPY